jgi:pimeloyl-ACP methyl ester carboxylesterase
VNSLILSYLHRSGDSNEGLHKPGGNSLKKLYQNLIESALFHQNYGLLLAYIACSHTGIQLVKLCLKFDPIISTTPKSLMHHYKNFHQIILYYMFHLKKLALSALTFSFMALFFIEPAQAQSTSHPAKNVVLVHGAFADGSSWSKVIPLLQARGLNVIAVQNPLTSLSDDVAATKRAIAMMEGPVLLVGHSWAGMVITEAGNDSKVAGLLYVAALIPDEGQSVGDVVKGYKPAPGNAEYREDASGFMSLTLKGVNEFFAQDVSALEGKVMFATQGPWAKAAASEKMTRAAWKTKPSWAIVASQDKMINPDVQRATAKMIKATTLTLNTSHVPMVSEPKKVADFIIKASEKLTAQQALKR